VCSAVSWFFRCCKSELWAEIEQIGHNPTNCRLSAERHESSRHPEKSNKIKGFALFSAARPHETLIDMSSTACINRFVDVFALPYLVNMTTFVARTRKQVIDENFEAFQQILPQILIAHHGKVALLRDRKLDGVFETAVQAIQTGKQRYPDKMFSVSTVEKPQPVSLGWYSHFHA
jgi:hypothetical protein